MVGFLFVAETKRGEDEGKQVGREHKQPVFSRAEFFGMKSRLMFGCGGSQFCGCFSICCRNKERKQVGREHKQPVFARAEKVSFKQRFSSAATPNFK